MSQAALGRLVHVSGDLVAKLEKAERRAAPELVERLDTALRAGGALARVAAVAGLDDVGCVRGTTTGPWKSDTGLAPSMRRLDRGTVLAAAKAWFGEATDPTSPSPSSGRVDDLSVTMVRERVRQLRRMDDAGGGPSILEWTLHDLRWARRLLHRRPGSQGPATMAALHRAVGELAQLAGWLACDAGAHGQAERLWSLGLDAARAAGDVRLGATIVSCLSYQALWTDHRSSALEFARMACQAARGLPGGAFQGLLATRQARAHARLGHERECEHHLAQARAHLDTARPDEDPEWVYWVTPGVLAADAGRARLDLGLSQRAVADLTTGLALFGGAQPRNRALHLTSLAEAHLTSGELPGAVESVGRALELPSVSDSRRVRQRLGGLAERLQRFPSADARGAADHIRSALAA